MKIAELSLGILTAVGGFVDVSELVFMPQAGSRFGYALVWLVVLATIIIIVFGEMSGRTAAIGKQPLFNLMRHRLGLSFGLIVLIASLIANTIICAAEIGGVALILQLVSGLPFRLMAIAATLTFAASIWLLPFKWIERCYGLLGLFMIIFLVAIVAIHPPWRAIVGGLVPQVPAGLSHIDLIAFSYFAVALLSAVTFPYETCFYSSGGIEEDWGPKDLAVNRMTTIVGFGLGSLLALALMAGGAQIFGPAGISPEMPGTVGLLAAVPFGKTGLLLALAGMFFAIAGAAIETCLANAYSLGQFFGWRWGRSQAPREAPRFTLSWLAFFAAALAIVMTGAEPVQLAEYAVVASVLVLPFTYLPLLLIAGDRRLMGERVNGVVSRMLGWGFFILICIVALAALPLFVLTRGGQL